MPRRQRGHPGETEPPENADHEGPAPADLLQMWITGRQPQTAAIPETSPEPSAVEGEPETDAEPAPAPDTGADQVQGWASFGHARTAEDVLERSGRKPWLDVLLGETATPRHPPAEPAKPALLRELDHDEEPTEAAEPEAARPGRHRGSGPSRRATPSDGEWRRRATRRGRARGRSVRRAAHGSPGRAG